MAKLVNLLGIRTKAMLCRTKTMGELVYTVMREITGAQEKEIDELKSVTIDNKIISKDNIYCYGEIDINNEEDIKYLQKFNIINLDAENSIHSGYDYEKGNVVIEGKIAMMRPTWDVIEWFKYNYMLIGKPKRVIIYKCKKHDL